MSLAPLLIVASLGQNLFDAQGYSACAVAASGDVRCWGQNDYGKLGVGDQSARGNEPGEMGVALANVSLPTGYSAAAVSVGYSHTCALLNGGAATCWGDNARGQLGLGDNNPRGQNPGELGGAIQPIDLGTGWTSTVILAGGEFTCALSDDGRIKCFGLNGVIGTGDNLARGDSAGEMGDALPPISLGAGRTVAQAATGRLHACVVLDDTSTKCWGSGTSGRLGYGDTTTRGSGSGQMGDSLPALSLGTGRHATALSLGGSHSCALLDDGSAKCWGSNDLARLGTGDGGHRGDGPGEMGDALPVRAAPRAHARCLRHHCELV